MLESGSKLGPYEVVDRLGAGGMGEVYRARDTRLGRVVALKVIRSDNVQNEDRRRRFLQEARAASSLSHPNIVGLFDILSDTLGDVLVMEYVEGRTLDKLIGNKGVPLKDALRWAIQIADGLAAAHRGGIIHRDLKPANIVVTEAGTVKLLDFGLAKFTVREKLNADGPTQTLAYGNDTDEGIVMGTVSYMSPEQAQGQPVDARSDIFSFGAVLYEILTGHKAFHGASTVSTLSAIVRDEPRPPTDYGIKLPHDLERLVARCLRKDLARRFQTAPDVKAALEDIRDESTSGHAHTAEAPRRSTHRKLAAIVVPALIAAVAGLWFVRQQQRQGDPVLLRAVPVTTDTGNESQPSFSPDASQIVYAAADTLGKDSDLYLVAFGTGTKLQLVSGSTIDTVPRWSPDGRWIAFYRSNEGIFLTSPLGGPLRRVAVLKRVYQMAWMPDSRRLLVGQESGPEALGRELKIVDIETGSIEQLDPGSGTGEGELAAMALSPDGKKLARFEEVNGSGHIGIYELSGTSLREEKTIPIDELFNRGMAFLPGGGILIASLGSTFNNARMFSFDIQRSRREPLLLDVQQAASPVFSREGDKMVFTRDAYDENLYRLALTKPGSTDGKPVPFATSTARDSNPNISPLGDRVAFASFRTGAPEIYVCDAAGDRVQRLTDLKANIGGSPRFSPDGKWIAFDGSLSANEFDIYLMPSEGGPPKRLTKGSHRNVAPTWSRDGKHIYFHSDRSGSSQIWKMQADGSNPVQITKGGGYIAFEAADRKSIFYSKSDSSVTQLWATGIEGGEERLVLNSLYRHNFSPTASGVYASTARGLNGGPEILYYRLADRTTKTVYQLTRPVALGLTIAADESWLLFSQLDGTGSDLMMVESFR
jgi:serine/threonine protein kinase/Tol biopolymer transport system component